MGPTSSTIQARDEFWYAPDDERFLSRETWNDGGTLRNRRVLYLGGDYEDTRPPAGSTYDIIRRIRVTDRVVRVQRRNASTAGERVLLRVYPSGSSGFG